VVQDGNKKQENSIDKATAKTDNLRLAVFTFTDNFLFEVVSLKSLKSFFRWKGAINRALP
jgi:hypothetical protein